VPSRLRSRPQAAVALTVLLVSALVVATFVAARPRSPSIPEVNTMELGPDPSMPLASDLQPPDPCKLLTTAEVTAAVGGHVDGVIPSTPATPESPVRRCDWSVVWGANTSGDVGVEAMTAAANTAARAVRSQYSQDPNGSVMALPVVFDLGLFTSPCGSCWHIANAAVLGNPAQYWADSGQAVLGVLTPSALLAVHVEASAHDEDTLIALSALAAKRLDGICPCGQESAPATAGPGILGMASQPPNPCELLRTEELVTPIGTILYDPLPAALAVSSNGTRTCRWIEVESLQVAVTLTIMTAASRAASEAAQHRVRPRRPETVPPSLHAALVANDQMFGAFPGHAAFDLVTVLGHPAQYVSNPPWLQVLTPRALLTVTAVGDGVAGDKATLIRYAKVALGRLNSTGP